MKAFFPLIFFAVSDEDEGVCDFILQGFRSKEDMIMLYPDCEFLELEQGKQNTRDN